MVPRPTNLLSLNILLAFNSKILKGLEIDLEHINRKKKRKLKIEEVAKIVTTLLYRKNLKEVDFKKYGNDGCSYYTNIGSSDGKNYKIVVCICSDKPEILGVITLYRV